MNILMFFRSRCLCWIMSNTLPGVPLIICTPISSFLMSYCIDFPPKQAWICTFRWSPSARATFWLCSASYRVGDRTRTWGALIPLLILCKAPRQKTAVFPVPDWLWTMTSLLEMIGIMALCWTAEGLSKPKITLMNYHSNICLLKVIIWAQATQKWGRLWEPHWFQFWYFHHES